MEFRKAVFGALLNGQDLNLANIAVFSVVNTILLRPLPFPHPGELARIHQMNPKAGESTMTRLN